MLLLKLQCFTHWPQVQLTSMTSEDNSRPECVLEACFVLLHLQFVQTQDVKPACHPHAAIQGDGPLKPVKRQTRGATVQQSMLTGRTPAMD